MMCKEKEFKHPAYPSYGTKHPLRGILKGIVGRCPKCGASHANESICHACDYEFKDRSSHDVERDISMSLVYLMTYGGCNVTEIPVLTKEQAREMYDKWKAGNLKLFKHQEDMLKKLEGLS